MKIIRKSREDDSFSSNLMKSFYEYHLDLHQVKLYLSMSYAFHMFVLHSSFVVLFHNLTLILTFVCTTEHIRFHTTSQPFVTNGLNLKVRYAYQRLQNPTTIDTKLEKLYEYVDNLLQQKRFVVDINKWDQEWDSIVAKCVRLKIAKFDLKQSLEMLQFQ